jgi:hypothetical protein
MEITYKVVLYGDTIKGSGSGDKSSDILKVVVTPRLEELKACCETMQRELVNNPSHFEFDVPDYFDKTTKFKWAFCINFRGYGEEGDQVKINFCPFCGQPITYKEVSRVTLVGKEHHIPEQTIINYHEEPVIHKSTD